MIPFTILRFFILDFFPWRQAAARLHSLYFGLVMVWSSSGHGLVMVWFYQSLASLTAVKDQSLNYKQTEVLSLPAQEADLFEAAH